MSSKKKAKRSIPEKDPRVEEEKYPERSNTLIFAGILLAISSIGLLIFVLSEKVFHLS